MKKDFVIMKFDHWRKVFAPYKCFCCGKDISKDQFKWSCLCGRCDVGFCLGEPGHQRKDIQKDVITKSEIVLEMEVVDSL